MINFSQLSPHGSSQTNAHGSQEILKLWQAFHQNAAQIPTLQASLAQIDQPTWQRLHRTWQEMTANASDTQLTDWLIELFALLFNHPNPNQIPTILVRGESEPEYFAPANNKPARIEFAHGFFQSALHEISHWCIAGKRRRLIDDFGYWYQPDGRDEATQALFEQVEIKPQAVECLLSLACDRYFYVSQDNLNADFDTSASSFASDVFYQAQSYLISPSTLPKDAQILIWVLLSLSHVQYYQNSQQFIDNATSSH